MRRLCPGYSIERCWRRSPKHRDKAAAASWIGRPPRRGSWNRAQLHAGVTDRRRFQWMFRSRPLAKPQSEVGWAKLLPECTALAIGLVPCSLTMDAQAETWIEVSGGSYIPAPDQLACLKDTLHGQVVASAKAQGVAGPSWKDFLIQTGRKLIQRGAGRHGQVDQRRCRREHPDFLPPSMLFFSRSSIERWRQSCE